MKKEKFFEGQTILQEDTEANTFYLISKGSVKIMKGNVFIRDMEVGSCFGEISLLNQEKRTASVIANGDVQTYVLTKEDFMTIIDKNMREYLQRKISLEDTSITLKDLSYVKSLGKGKFGSVYLVTNKKNFYAVKVVSRRMAEKRKILSKYFVAERRIMLSIDHPFIVKLVKTMKMRIPASFYKS